MFNLKREGKGIKLLRMNGSPPPHLLKDLGEFDLDPCAPIVRPWETAKKHYTEMDNGLMKNWEGRVWCNPPYGDETLHWLNKCALHGNAIALTFARTETGMFFQCVWNTAHAVLFLKGRLIFYNVDGTPAKDKKGRPSSAGAPSVLIAYDNANADFLSTCKIKGKFIRLK